MQRYRDNCVLLYVQTSTISYLGADKHEKCPQSTGNTPLWRGGIFMLTLPLHEAGELESMEGLIGIPCDNVGGNGRGFFYLSQSVSCSVVSFSLFNSLLSVFLVSEILPLQEKSLSQRNIPAQWFTQIPGRVSRSRILRNGRISKLMS
jgi:hypothetical protein